MKTSSATTARQTPTDTTVRPKKKRVFVFDATGKLLGEYESVTLCAEKLRLGRPCINAGLQRGSIVNSRYYISYNEKFKIDEFKFSHNPLHPRAQHVYGGGSHASFLSQDFFEVIS